MKYPTKKPTAKTAKTGPLALLQLLREVESEAFEVPLGEDYGIDVLAQVPHLYYAEPEGGSTGSLPRLSPWLREWVNRTVAQAAGSGPASVLVLGRFIGFQVKTSDTFTPGDEVWTLDLGVRHLNYWRNCDFPVVLVASSGQGNLRYLMANEVTLTEKQQKQSTIRVGLMREFDEEAATALLDKSRSEAARAEALVRTLALLEPDAEAQRSAVDASWAASPDVRVSRLLRTALPLLEHKAQEQAMVLFAALIELCRGDAEDSESAAEWKQGFQDALDELGAGDALEYSMDAWHELCSHWTMDQTYAISFAPVWTGPESFSVLPSDPWPDAPPEDEVYRLARAVRSALPSLAVWDAVAVLLSRASQPLNLLADLAVREISAEPADPSLGDKWLSLTFEVIDRLVGPAPCQRFLAINEAEQELDDWRQRRAADLTETVDCILSNSPSASAATDRLRALLRDLRPELRLRALPPDLGSGM